MSRRRELVSGERERTIVVLKFGGSVLEHEDGYRAAAREVVRERASGRRVVAVVSARTGATDELLRLVRGLAREPDPAGLSELLGTGEEASAWLLGIAAREAGLDARVVTRARLALRTSGPRLDADPVSVDLARLHGELWLADLVVVPGFVGVHVDGGPSLLGRGGSDLTALFLARELRADCRLVKDVDGLFTADPRHETGAGRYVRATWEEVDRVGNDLVQGKALRYAAAFGLRFRIAAMGAEGTLVGDGPNELAGSPALEVAS